MLKLSILIPFYNAGEHLERCLESVLNQDIDKSEYEILLINDGSTDNGAEIVTGFQKINKNIQLFQHENQGVYTQRNKLLDLAKGQYLYFMDADDYIAFNSLGTILKAAIDHKAEFAGFGSKVIGPSDVDDDDHTSSIFKNATYDIQQTSGSQILVDQPNMRYEIWWYFIKKGFLERLKLRFVEKKLSGDVLFTITLLLRAKNAVYCDAPVYRYYQSENSIQRNSKPENLSKLAESSTFQLINLMALLQDIKNDLGADSLVYDKLRQKRDINVFYLFLRLTKNNYPKAKILKVYDTLKEKNVLPRANASKKPSKKIKESLASNWL